MLDIETETLSFVHPISQVRYEWKRTKGAPITLFRRGQSAHLDQPALMVLRALMRVREAFDLRWGSNREGESFASHEHLARAGWPTKAFDASSGSRLRTQIGLLRKALDEGDGEAIIRTIPGKGYQFLPAVESDVADSRVAFIEFFGLAGSRTPGAIVLQPQAVDKVLADYVPGILSAASVLGGGRKGKRRPVVTRSVTAIAASAILPSTRLYKARSWINRWDAEGAEAVRELFRDKREGVPNLVASEVHDERTESAPVVFSMGLGFAPFTDRVLEGCREWVKVEKGRAGDAIELHKGLLQGEDLSEFSVLGGQKTSKFAMLLPKEWNIDRWLTMVDDPNGHNPSHDYAIILRRTATTSAGRQVRFLLAGFTERGTAVAAKYLARNWKELHRRFFPHGQKDRRSLGDFMLVIHGDSRAESFGRWTAAKFPAITPQLVYELGKRNRDVANSAWAQRF